MPGRYKALHYYNAGAIFDAFMAVFKPMLSKKMQERVKHFQPYGMASYGKCRFI